jgi:branched-chain amino acid aminotransferase
MKKTEYIWLNGKMVKWDEAKVHVLTHALHYGTAVFEGIRAYSTKRGTDLFRVRDHYKRLIDSGKIYLMKIDYTVDELIDITHKLIKANNIKECYIRPIFYYGYGTMGLNPSANPIEGSIAVWEWGTYLGEEGLKKGIRCKISSWKRIDGSSIPPLAKCSANYINSVLAKTEAINCGYEEAIMLNPNGTVSEGPGENIFMIKDNKIYTPPASDCALMGITCQSAQQIAKDLGYSVSTRSITRDELFLADELFFTGTAAEVTPICEIDGRIIGEGSRGPVTEKIQSKFFEIVRGEDPKYDHWLDFVH